MHQLWKYIDRQKIVWCNLVSFKQLRKVDIFTILTSFFSVAVVVDHFSKDQFATTSGKSTSAGASAM